MSFSCNDITPADRDAVVSAYAAIRLEAPNGARYSIFCDKQYPWLVPVAENVQRLLWYENNWDSHGGLSVNQTAMQESFSILSRVMSEDKPIPRLSLTPSGGIQMEWRVPKALLQIEVEYNGTISAFFSDTRAGAEPDWEDDSVAEISLLQEKLSKLRDAA
jgi:hypothetical protein